MQDNVGIRHQVDRLIVCCLSWLVYSPRGRPGVAKRVLSLLVFFHQVSHRFCFSSQHAYSHLIVLLTAIQANVDTDTSTYENH